MQITVKTEKVAANALSLGELRLMLCLWESCGECSVCGKVVANALSVANLRLMICRKVAANALSAGIDS